MTDFFANSLDHLFAELERIDLLVRGQVARARSLQTDDEQFRGLYISEQEVDALLDKPIGIPQWLRPESSQAARAEPIMADLGRQIRERKQESRKRGIVLRLESLRQCFGLNRFDVDTLLICLAPELDLRYERLYAYLQDDITKKKPSVELVLNLLAPSIEGKLVAMPRLSPGAALLRNQLVELLDDPGQPRPPLIGKYLRVDDRITRFLFGSDEPDERILFFVESVEPCLGLDELPVNEDVRRGLRGLAADSPDAARNVVHLHGPLGVGKQRAAEALCHEKGMRCLVVDLGRLVDERESAFAKAVALAEREAGLQGAVLYWKGFDALFAEQFRGLLREFRHRLEERRGLSILGGEAPWDQGEGLRGVSYFSVALPRPTALQRMAFWRDALGDSSCAAGEADIVLLATKFRLTGGQIRNAVVTAGGLARWRDPHDVHITLQDLYNASRTHSNQQLGTLARKVTPAFAWSDIVLPVDRVAQLREICNHVTYRERVYGEWGFERKLSLGKGLTVLFAGPSGTGKTMAAEILAGELGLDLYKIDLSSVISKYIGETEKNLAHIFDEAETSNAILFFDEADALFGKRSEVRDSHDRYANIEVGYLLQRMEEYQGVAILATNFRKNMDEAFVRRLQFTVDFPFPNQSDRHRIWSGIWPDETPCDAQMDLEFLARRFEITGGNIRNIALASAFLAADDGNIVRMDHVLVATQREYGKMGKLVAEGEFKVVGTPS